MAEVFDPVLGSSEPQRFWTLANASEVTPGIMTPMCWSVWNHFEVAGREAWYDLGIMRRKDVYLPDDPNERQTAVFYGRHAMNVDQAGSFMGLIPGASAEDFERDILGSVREDLPPSKKSMRRLPAIASKTPWVMLTNTRRVHAFYKAQSEWWSQNAMHPAAPGSALNVLHEAADRFRQGMRLHVRVRCLLQGAQSMLTGIAGSVNAPQLGAAVFSGYGNVAELGLADKLWQVSRKEMGLEEFVESYGFHGPNEGMVYTTSWREDRSSLARLVTALESRDESERPALREKAAIAARMAAEKDLLALLPPTKRVVARWLFVKTGNQVRNIEMTKAAYLMGLDVCRSAARRVGKDLVHQGHIADTEDVFFLTLEELDSTPPEDFAKIVEYRRAQRKTYESIEIPMTFYGMPEDIGKRAYEGVDRLVGIAASRGVVEGLARVVVDPNSEEIVEPGEILVCRTTDPSWAPLFSLTDGLVIDLGSVASHGAIVAREMGIPCVINSGNGTSEIRTGDRIRVDGTEGVVDILERRSEATS
ncbi:PEP-utilizing enzyme [Nocardia brevicatena]|uniref:PEP-utilizing enzyme n=1 Tax=Nocardia brevicatena TaxID=37327 RepID=UPI0002E49C93|nr:PEP-utilizing enzyme [Nocardia brevicatena]